MHELGLKHNELFRYRRCKRILSAPIARTGSTTDFDGLYSAQRLSLDGIGATLRLITPVDLRHSRWAANGRAD